MSSVVRLTTFVTLICLAPVGRMHAEPQPADESWEGQIRLLAATQPQEARLRSLKWMETHRKEKGAASAIPALEDCTRKDPDAEVRCQAAQVLGVLALELKRPCPLAVVEALLDKDDDVAYLAGGAAGLFEAYETGSVDVLLRCVASPSPRRRSSALSLLPRAAKKDEKALRAIEAAKRDKDPSVRYHAHNAFYLATDKLDDLMGFVVRLSDDASTVWPIDPKGGPDADNRTPENRMTERQLVVISNAQRAKEWSAKRPAETAAVLVRLLDDKSAATRRAAANAVGRFANAAAVDPDSKIVPEFARLKVGERLLKLSESDPEASVREAAGESLKRLRAGTMK